MWQVTSRSCEISVSSRPQRPEEIAMFRGEGVWGRSKGWGLGRGCAPPQRGSGGCAPRKFFEILQQILAKYSTFLPITCVDKEFFTVVNRQKYTDNNKNSSPWTNFCEDPHCQFTVCYSVSRNVYNERRCLTRMTQHSSQSN